jgi:hypothetical protein
VVRHNLGAMAHAWAAFGAALEAELFLAALANGNGGIACWAVAITLFIQRGLVFIDRTPSHPYSEYRLRIALSLAVQLGDGVTDSGKFRFFGQMRMAEIKRP